MIGTDRLIEALAVAIDAKKSGRQADMTSAIGNFERAFTSAVDSAMAEAFRNGSISGSTSFRDAVRKVTNPGQLFS